VSRGGIFFARRSRRANEKPGHGRAEYARTPPHPGREFGYQPIMWLGSHVTICGKRMHSTNTSTCSTINGYKNIREGFNAGNAI
jgi:hypothetical protein